MFKTKVSILLIISMISLPALAHFGENGRGFAGPHMGFFGGFWMMPLFLVVAVLSIGWLINFFFKPNEKQLSANNLQYILKERLARGEINHQDYEELKKTLK